MNKETCIKILKHLDIRNPDNHIIVKTIKIKQKRKTNSKYSVLSKVP